MAEATFELEVENMEELSAKIDEVKKLLEEIKDFKLKINSKRVEK
jgi:hypothetical protein